jgi:hypothetical protein
MRVREEFSGQAVEHLLVHVQGRIVLFAEPAHRAAEIAVLGELDEHGQRTAAQLDDPMLVLLDV